MARLTKAFPIDRSPSDPPVRAHHAPLLVTGGVSLAMQRARNSAEEPSTFLGNPQKIFSDFYFKCAAPDASPAQHPRLDTANSVAKKLCENRASNRHSERYSARNLRSPNG